MTKLLNLSSFILGVSLFFALGANAQKITISGNVYNQNTNEIIIGATIFDNNTQKATSTNNFGFYSYTCQAKDTINLTISSFGYSQLDTIVAARTNTYIDFYLNDKQIQTVTVRANSRNQISTVEIPLENIKIMPTLTGEKDILKAYQLMPGIQSGKEGSSSLHVRGGSPDQNLILIDDVPVYYINHLGGFVSIFDNNAINSFKVMKGGFPARYGGRLSSVIDVRLKDGDMQKFTGEISAGLIASKISLQGPIIKNKTSFIVSARRCNLDLITKPLLYFSQNGATAGYTFYDLNLKIRHKINKRNSIYFTTYLGNDNIKVNFNNTDESDNTKSLMLNKWGNQNIAFRWNHVYNSKLFSNFTLAFSKFYYQTHEEYEERENFVLKESFLHSYKIDIRDLIAKIDYDYYLSPNNSLKFGAYYTYKNYNPGKEQYRIKTEDLNLNTTNNNQQLFSGEFAIYAEDDFSFRNSFFLNFGIHASGYSVQNSFFYSVQPRILPKIKIYENIFVSASYTRMKQYIHLLSNNATGMPYDMWMPATKNAKPENAEQVSAGISNFFEKINLFVSVEAYYKQLDNLIEQNATLSVTDIETTWEERIFTEGESEIYGVEFLIQKSVGKLSGWLSYVWSKNYRTFAQINNGSRYPYTYDRLHDFSAVVNYRATKKITLSGTWVFATGSPTTLGISKVNLVKTHYFASTNGLSNYPQPANFENVYIYGTINNYRMPNYHRLDLAINRSKKLKRGVATWSLSLYNVYNRKNPYFLFLAEDDNNQTQLYKFSLFPIIPSISYSFKF